MEMNFSAQDCYMDVYPSMQICSCTLKFCHVDKFQCTTTHLHIEILKIGLDFNGQQQYA